MRLVVGLGNPGPQYSNHRHNAGFMVADVLHARANGSEWREKYIGFAARAVIAGCEVTLLKPQTFMNLSGRAVQRAVQQIGCTLPDLLVIHDDLELAYGDVRAKLGGGHGGHNGLRDLHAHIGADFARVRVGIGRPLAGTVEHHVLSGFTPEECQTLEAVIARAADVAEAVVGQGIASVLPPGPRAPSGNAGRKR